MSVTLLPPTQVSAIYIYRTYIGCACDRQRYENKQKDFIFNPFPTLVTSEVTSHFGPVPKAPCGPRTARRSGSPVQSVQGAGAGYGWVLPRGLQASLGQSRRSARALAVAVRVV